MIRSEILTREIRQLLMFSPLQYMLDVVAENPRYAHIFTDRVDAPACCALRFGHYLWLAGTVQENAADIADTIRGEQMDILNVFYDHAAAAQAIKDHFPNVYDTWRCVFQQTPVRQEIDQPTRVTPISRALLGSDVGNLDMIINEVTDTATYDNLDAFCRKGFGFTFIASNEVGAFCTSEYQSRTSVAIGIEVARPYQQQGIAKEMTMAFLQEAANRGLDVYWECWQQNEPSIRTAFACGFHKVADYPVLFIDLSKPS